MRLAPRFVLAALVLASAMASPAIAQVGQILNRNVVQPDVWRPSTVEAPGIDGRGDVNLQIPVLTVPGKDGLDFPITFAYSSSIRLDERSTWVGTGWRFDPGSITRDVYGAEKGNPTVTSYADFAGEPPFQPDRYVVTLPAGGATMSRVVNAGSTSTPTPRTIASGFYTLEFNGWKIESNTSNNGAVNNPVTVNGQQTGIRTSTFNTRSDYTGFTVRTVEGVRYIFAIPTLSTSLATDVAGPASLRRETFVSAWRLRAILSPTYSGPDIPTGTEAGAWIRIDYSPVNTQTNPNSPTLGPEFVQATYPTRIVTPTHCASFSTTSRNVENLPGWERPAYAKLTGISLYAGGTLGTSCTGTPIRHAQLSNPEELRSESASGSSDRPALRSISSTGQGGSLEPGYAFEYYPLLGGTALDDSRMDLFGFYDPNGGYTGGYDAGCGVGEACNDGASFSLKKVVYPSGGSDEFEYQNDQITT